jgi:hypothetical protein
MLDVHRCPDVTVTVTVRQAAEDEARPCTIRFDSIVDELHNDG